MTLSWKNVDRKKVPGGWLELRDGNELLRGPITTVIGPKVMPVFQLHWLARKPAGQVARWEAWDYHAARTFGTEQWPVTSLCSAYVTFATAQTDKREEYWGRIYFRGHELMQPGDVPNLPDPVDDTTKWAFPRVLLPEQDWNDLCDPPGISLMDGPEDYPGLPRCCANVSALREAIEGVRANYGYVWPASERELIQSYGWVMGEDGGGHPGPDWSILNRFMSQAVPELKLFA
jgi:hypothetical protein